LWEERERTRAEIVAAVDAAEVSLARGEGRTITQESMRQLADEVKQRGRARLANEHSSSHQMAHRVAPEAEAELDNIWYYVAKDSGSIRTSDAAAMRICALDCVAFPRASTSSSTASKKRTR
jgi:hypothetical protein